MTGRTIARLLAPIALVSTALALFLILSSGGGGQDETSVEREASGQPPATTTTNGTGEGREGREGRGRRTYTVKPGDTPSAIAEKVGIPLQELLDLNPEVDPQTLNPGEKLRLR